MQTHLGQDRWGGMAKVLELLRTEEDHGKKDIEVEKKGESRVAME